MKSRFLFICMFSLFYLVGSFGCDSDLVDSSPVNLDGKNEANASLLRVWSSSGLPDGTLYLEQLYEYDEAGRVIKISKPMYKDGEMGDIGWYNTYTYNDQNQCIEDAYWVYNADGKYRNLTITTFEYDKEGLKIKETSKYPVISGMDWKTFEYEKGLLSRMNEYDGSGKLLNYVLYEYDKEGRLSRETVCNPISNKASRYSLYSYENGLNTQVDVYTFMNMQNEFVPLRKITNEYDANRNLIRKESEELCMTSSMSSFTWVYEYEKTE